MTKKNCLIESSATGAKSCDSNNLKLFSLTLLRAEELLELDESEESDFEDFEDRTYERPLNIEDRDVNIQKSLI